MLCAGLREHILWLFSPITLYSLSVTPWEYARYASEPSMVAGLLLRRAMITKGETDYDKAMELAAKRGHLEIILLFLKSSN